MKKTTKKNLYIGGGILSLAITGALIYYFFFYKKKEVATQESTPKNTDTGVLVAVAAGANTSVAAQTVKTSVAGQTVAAKATLVQEPIGVPLASASEKAFIPFAGDSLLASEIGANQSYAAYVNDANRSRWTATQLSNQRSQANASKVVATRERATLERKNARLLAEIAAIENQISNT